MKIATALMLFALGLAQTTTQPSLDCQVFLLAQASNLETPCGLKQSDLTNTTNLYNLANTITKSLKLVCSDGCGEALKASATALTEKKECSNVSLSGMNVASVVSSYNLGRSAVCVKTTNGGYCAIEQLKTLKPVFDSVDPMNAQAAILSAVSNKDFICTDCFQNQVNTLNNAELPASFKSQWDAVTALKELCGGNITTVVGQGDNKKGAATRTSTALTLAIASIAMLQLIQ
jgi:hypothetical protein